MKRVLRQTVTDVCLLGLAILAGLAVVLTQRWQLERPSGDASGPLVPAFTEAQPSRLVFMRNGQSVRVVTGAPTGESSPWVVESPWKRSAEQATLDAAIAALRDMRIVRKLELKGQVTADDLSRLGLEHPNFTWQVGFENSIWTFAFGADSPEPRRGTYVDVTPPGSSTHEFYVVSVDLSKLSLVPEQLIEPRLVPYVPSELNSVTLESGTVRASFHFDATRSRWFDTDGQHYRVSRAAFDALLLQLTTLKAAHFLGPSEAASKHSPKMSAGVTLGLTKSHSTIRLEFGGPCEGEPSTSLVAVVGSEDVTACADARALLARLARGPSEWLDNCAFSVRPDEVESLEAASSGHSWQLERWESAFRFTGADPKPVELEPGNRLLQAMLSTCGKLVSPSPPGILPFDANNFIRVRSAVIGDTDRYEERVLVGPALANGDRYVKREMDGALLRIPRTEVDALMPDEKQLTLAKPTAERFVDAGGE